MNEKILGIKVTTKSKKEILQELEKDIKNNKRNISDYYLFSLKFFWFHPGIIRFQKQHLPYL